MTHRVRPRVLRGAIAVLLMAGACSNDANQTEQEARSAAPDSPASTSAPAGAAPDAPAELTAADLDAYERGITKEIELVRAAQARANVATTPQARGEAMQAQWEDQTIPDGARGANLEESRYREVRTTVHRVFQTLDFQGKIDGPMQMDTARAAPEMRQRLASDPFDELSASSRAALRERMDRLVPRWVEYVTLTAVAG